MACGWEGWRYGRLEDGGNKMVRGSDAQNSVRKAEKSRVMEGKEQCVSRAMVTPSITAGG